MTAEERTAAVEFLTTIELAGRDYVGTVFVGRSGEQPVIYQIGLGDVEGGLNLWQSNLDSYRKVLTALTPPQNVANSSEIRTAGLDALNSTVVWIDEVLGRLESGEVVDPVNLLMEIEQRFQSAEDNIGIGLKEQFRIHYEIDELEVPRACGGRQGGNCV